MKYIFKSFVILINLLILPGDSLYSMKGGYSDYQVYLRMDKQKFYDNERVVLKISIKNRSSVNNKFTVFENKMSGGPDYSTFQPVVYDMNGHEAEIKAPMWGFLKTPEGDPIITLGRTIQVSASLEASGELSEHAANLGYTPGSTSEWGSDTAEPFDYLIADPATSLAYQPTHLLPVSSKLYQNYPNPFNPTTKIEYELTVGSFVILKVFNILGKEIRTLINENKAPGLHTLTWDATDNYGKSVGTGYYILQLQANAEISSSRMILIR